MPPEATYEDYVARGVAYRSLLKTTEANEDF